MTRTYCPAALELASSIPCPTPGTKVLLMEIASHERHSGDYIDLDLRDSARITGDSLQLTRQNLQVLQDFGIVDVRHSSRNSDKILCRINPPETTSARYRLAAGTLDAQVVRDLAEVIECRHDHQGQQALANLLSALVPA